MTSIVTSSINSEDPFVALGDRNACLILTAVRHLALRTLKANLEHWRQEKKGTPEHLHRFAVAEDILYQYESEQTNLMLKAPLTSLPPFFCCLHKITSLTIESFKNLEKLPQMPNLQCLAVLDYEGENVFSALENQTQLISLSVIRSTIQTLPSEIEKFTNLQGLLIRDCKMRKIPAEIGNLPHLVGLVLDNNWLSRFPVKALAKLSSSCTISADRNLLNIKTKKRLHKAIAREKRHNSTRGPVLVGTLKESR